MKCPIALQKQRRAHAPALAHLTYQELDLLVRRLAGALSGTPAPIIGCLPKGRIEDIALFFAAWRLRKVVYPVSCRYPPQEIEKRFRAAHAKPFDPKPADWLYQPDTLDLHAPATLIETASGDKIACHPLSAHLASARAVNRTLAIAAGARYGLILPLFHISGIAAMLRTFVAGAHLLLADEVQRATHLSAVSTQLFRFVREKKQLPYLKCLLVGGGPLPENLTNAPYPLCTSYGMTEAASTIAIDGIPLNHLEVKMENDEIHIRGASLMHGYLGQEPILDWFATGNTGQLEGGRLRVWGRRDRAFISGGEKIQPETIERALLAIEGISQARVTWVEDPEYGQVPLAHIAAHRHLSATFLSQQLQKKLPRYMIPKRFERHTFNASKLSKMAEQQGG